MITRPALYVVVQWKSCLVALLFILKEKDSTAPTTGSVIMVSKYQWPSSALSEKEMQILFNEKQRTGKSINLLIKEAVLKTYHTN